MAAPYLPLVVAIVYLLFGVAHSQNATSTYSQSNVPTGTPIAGNYAGPLRPQVHFSPPKGFMNDPNGMFVDADGVYHLYYQYNPTANVAGNQHWGHATSKDLYTWTNQQIALFPGGPEEGIFSGSAVIDVNNTSGFFPNQTNGVVAIYTLNTPEKQTQDIAYSYDGGYTFIKYAQNPVIDRNSTQFRDPKVFWYPPTERWVMVVAYCIDFSIGIFSSPNLVDWTPESNFTRHGILGQQYECPNLVEMPVNGSASELTWVMLISINPGAPLGGSISEYFPGSFNGTHFAAIDAAARLTDFAKDNYAAQFFGNIPGTQDQISISWASNWQYTNVVPTDKEDFRSVMSVPHSHHLTAVPNAGLTMLSSPHNISAIIDRELASNTSLGNSTLFIDFSTLPSSALYWEANITSSSSAPPSGALNFTFLSTNTGERIAGGTTAGADIWLDRGKTDGFENPYFTDKFSANGRVDGSGVWRVSGILDRSIIEVFLNGGELSATSVFYPTEPLDGMVVSAGGIGEGSQASVAVWGLKAAWLGEADGEGNVKGNVTES